MADVFDDTPEQSIAQGFDRHISVTANAGSGKTTILKKRFISIALSYGSECDPRRIVAITFTRKAAGEIFAKIAEEFEKLLSVKSGSEITHKQLFNIRSNLKSANISTIHGFCASLLRDFPIEAGVSPNFIELNEADNLKLTNDAILFVLTEKLSNDSETGKYRKIFKSFGRSALENFIKIMLSKRESLTKIKSIYSSCNDDIIKWISDEFFDNFLNHFKINLIDALTVIQKMMDIPLKNTNESLWKETYDSFIKLSNEIDEQNLNLNEFKNIYKTIITKKELLNANSLLTKSFTINSRTYRKDKFNFPEEYNSKLIRFFSHLNTFEILTTIANLDDTLNYARTLIELTDSVIDFINSEKETNNMLDFDDLLFKANDMLKDPEICEKIRKRFDYIMIDEFQDTNDIQYEIVKSLIPELSDSSLENKINLFIVGDPKQSIYGFRNADVRVFNKAMEDIHSVNKRLLDDKLIPSELPNNSVSNRKVSENELLGNMELSISFRHKPIVSAFTNIILRKLMEQKESEYDVSYSDLICTKMKDHIANMNDTDKLQLGFKYGSVTFISAIPDTKQSSNPEDEVEEDEIDSDNENSEYELLAKHILNIINNNLYGKQYTFKDIAILGRRKKKFPLLTQAFQKYNIPYIMQSGSGFYNAQEVMDLLSVLKFLHNNLDDIALVSALRSPFFSIPDEILTKLSFQFPKVNYWNKIKMLLENHYDDELLIRAKNILDKLIEYSTKLSISHLLMEIIEMTSFDGTIANIQGKLQVKANLNKLMQMARDFEKRGFKNLYDFVDEVNFMSAESKNENEAVILTDDDAVNIMTIHASKGLEFPIVVLFDSSSGTANNDSLIIDEKYGLGFKSINYNPAFDVFEKSENLINFVIKNRNDSKEKAELKRLLYVALTRAEEHIIISSTKYKKNNSLLSLILSAMDLELDAYLQTREFNMDDNLQFYNDSKIEQFHLGFSINHYTNIPLNESKTPEKVKTHKPNIPKFLFGKIQTKRNNEYFSASKFMSFDKNIFDYYSKYLLEFEGQDDYKFATEDNNDDWSGSLAGSIIHKTLEKIDEWTNAKGELIEQNLNRTIERTLTFFKIQNVKEYFEKTHNQILNLMETKLIKSNRKNIKNSAKEFSLNLPVDEDFLTAQIDLLFKHENGIVEIWDWKSNNITSKDMMLNVANNYRIQMNVYAYIISFLYPTQQNIKAKLLFTQMAKPNLNDEDWTIDFVWSKEELKEFETQMFNKIEVIKPALN